MQVKIDLTRDDIICAIAAYVKDNVPEHMEIDEVDVRTYADSNDRRDSRGSYLSASVKLKKL